MKGKDRLMVVDELGIDTDLVRQRIVDFLRQEYSRAGFSRAVIGLSGGIDSALACWLAVEALGRENVRAVLMPYGCADSGGEADARLLIGKLRIPHVRVNIKPMVDPLVESYPEMGARRRGNIMARMRMIVLLDQSEEFGGLVVGTSNKTEILLGYFTLGGDSVAAVKPLGDLYKCQVRQLSRAVGVPEHIITKPPSAGLWDGQTDEGELGFSYDDADRVLSLFVDEKMNEEEIVQTGLSKGLVRRVLQRMQATEFKRVSVPVAMVPRAA